MMANPENDELQKRVSDPRYANYIKTNICLEKTKQGIEETADHVSKKLQKKLLSLSQGKSSVCVGGCVVSEGRTCHVCTQVVGRLNRYCADGFRFTEKSWENTDCSGWLIPGGHWETAKPFMPKSQNKEQNSPAQTDIYGILHFIQNCSIGKKYVSTPDYIKKVLDARKAVVHNPEMALEDKYFKYYTDCMLQLLEDMETRHKTEDLVIAIYEIKKVRESRFRITAVMEYSVVEEQMKHFDLLINNAHDNYKILTDTCQDINADIAAYLESTGNFNKQLTNAEANEMFRICEKLKTKFKKEDTTDLLATMTKRIDHIQANAKFICQAGIYR